jgi:predicted short-subunit dehydrogenase-like oxidoreductase (DUF2520 family)
MTLKNSVALVGTGNIAWHLGNAFVKSGIGINEVYGRNKSKSEELAQVFDAACVQDIALLKSKYVFVCVSDDSIETMIAQIPENLNVIYTSGALGMDIFKNRNNVGVLYPLQTFGDRLPSDFKAIPILIEANDENLLNEVHFLASIISSEVHVVNSEQRLIYHLAAVWMNNFVNHIGNIAYDIIQEHQLDWGKLQLLIEKTTTNLLINNPKNIQTGPAKRNDLNTISKHLEHLNEEQKVVYNILSESIKKKYNPNG